jgi:DNA-binding NarL/FixJ family response regulator
MSSNTSFGSPLSRALRVFLCHSTVDKPIIRNLHRRLRADGIAAWIDEEELLPGQDWEQEITKAVRDSDIVLVCLSRDSINKAGYVQKEIKFALDVADQQPEGAVFIIPLRLEKCEVPIRLSRWQWVDLFESTGYGRLMLTLNSQIQSAQVQSSISSRAKSRELSERELEVLALVGNGASTKQIAFHLSINEATVRYHFKSIFGKLGVSNRSELLIRAYQMNLLESAQSSEVESRRDLDIGLRTLTHRELEVLDLIKEGLKNRAIASRLGISERTVQHHLNSIFSKLNLSDRFELMTLVYRYNIGTMK